MCRVVVAAVAIIVLCGITDRDAEGQVLARLTPEHVEEAIRLSADDAGTRRFLQAYVIQSRAGWGNGPPIGWLSTPFARVVQAARAARSTGRSFAASDVSPD